MKPVSLDILKGALWSSLDTTSEITDDVYQEFRDHEIDVLVYDVVSKMPMSEELYNKWTRRVVQQDGGFTKYIDEQFKLVRLMEDKGLYPVILKGLSSSLYYPEPSYRIVGDIDCIPFPPGEESFNKTIELLEKNGFQAGSDYSFRHLEYRKNGFYYEIHHYFSRKKGEEEKELDRIIESSNPRKCVLKQWPDYYFYSFSDEINGLILLQHIKQHLGAGLGFRQIIDWMYFVENVVTEEFWQETLKPLTDRTQLTTLAKVVTKMGELYLGERPHMWACDADVKVCKELYEFVDASGNMGRKRNQKDNGVVTVLNQRAGGFKGLQKRGLSHWPAAQKHRILRPFAWLYQIGRYIKKGLFERDSDSEGLLKSFMQYRKQKKLIAKLGMSKKY